MALMTTVVYSGDGLQAQYKKDLPEVLRPYVIHYPYFLVIDKVVLSSWEEVRANVSLGPVICLCRIPLPQKIVDEYGGKVPEVEDYADVPAIPDIAPPVIDEEYLDLVRLKSMELADIAGRVEAGEITKEEAEDEANTVVAPLVKETAAIAPEIL